MSPSCDTFGGKTLNARVSEFVIIERDSRVQYALADSYPFDAALRPRHAGLRRGQSPSSISCSLSPAMGRSILFLIEQVLRRPHRTDPPAALMLASCCGLKMPTSFSPCQRANHPSVLSPR